MPRNGGQARPVSFSVSQNFLTSRSIIERLLRLTDINPGDHVIEIGAGKGHITRALLHRCGRVSAYEPDPRLHTRLLADAEAAEGRLHLKCQDFLRASLPREPYKVFSNIPFNLTTDILRRLAWAPRPPEQAWLVMEKGAAKRFLGRPGENTLSLQLKPFFDLEIVYHFRREDFHPAPGVDTVLLHMRRKPQPDIPAGERDAFAAFVREGLCRGLPLSRRQIAAALRRDGLPGVPASGTMLYVQWLCLFRCSRQQTAGRNGRKT